LTAVYHIWGGTNYTQYLGSFSCLFCQEVGSDSINHPFGPYGNPFSSTSIRNAFSSYGGAFSANSACYILANNPPRVFDADRKVYYGELTLNPLRVDAIRTSSVANWLETDVCRH
jgi:hypothetical protein